MNTKIIPLFQPWIGNLTVLMSCLSTDPDLSPCEQQRGLSCWSVRQSQPFPSMRTPILIPCPLLPVLHVQVNWVRPSWSDGAHWGEYHSHWKKEGPWPVGLVRWPSFSSLRNGKTSEQWKRLEEAFVVKEWNRRGSWYQYSMIVPSLYTRNHTVKI